MLESMRWTLHGVHELSVTAEVNISQGPNGISVVFSNIQAVWNDRADLHSGVSTQTDSGEEVADDELMGSGIEFDIRIPFSPPDTYFLIEGDQFPVLQSGWFENTPSQPPQRPQIEP